MSTERNKLNVCESDVFLPMSAGRETPAVFQKEFSNDYRKIEFVDGERVGARSA